MWMYIDSFINIFVKYDSVRSGDFSIIIKICTIIHYVSIFQHRQNHSLVYGNYSLYISINSILFNKKGL